MWYRSICDLLKKTVYFINPLQNLQNYGIMIKNNLRKADEKGEKV